jgi:hypothetical protein
VVFFQFVSPSVMAQGRACVGLYQVGVIGPVERPISSACVDIRWEQRREDAWR